MHYLTHTSPVYQCSVSLTHPYPLPFPHYHFITLLLFTCTSSSPLYSLLPFLLFLINISASPLPTIHVPHSYLITLLMLFAYLLFLSPSSSSQSSAPAVSLPPHSLTPPPSPPHSFTLHPLLMLFTHLLFPSPSFSSQSFTPTVSPSPPSHSLTPPPHPPHSLTPPPWQQCVWASEGPGNQQHGWDTGSHLCLGAGTGCRLVRNWSILICVPSHLFPCLPLPACVFISFLSVCLKAIVSHFLIYSALFYYYFLIISDPFEFMFIF